MAGADFLLFCPSEAGELQFPRADFWHLLLEAFPQACITHPGIGLGHQLDMWAPGSGKSLVPPWERNSLQGLRPTGLPRCPPLFPRSGKQLRLSTPGCCVWHVVLTDGGRQPVVMWTCCSLTRTAGLTRASSVFSSTAFGAKV